MSGLDASADDMARLLAIAPDGGLVLIEINETASNRSQFVQPADPGLNVGSSPGALVRLGKEKGYELISVTKTNLLFVDAQYYGLFAIPDNSLEVMRDDEDATSVYVGMDGSVHLDGPARLVWHGVPLHMAQPLPGILRHYPPTYNLLQRILFRLYRILTYRGAATT